MRKTVLTIGMLVTAVVAFAGTTTASTATPSDSAPPVDPADLPVCATGYVGPCCETWENPVQCTLRVGFEITYGAAYFLYASCTAAFDEGWCYNQICNTWTCMRLDPCQGDDLKAEIKAAPEA